ncbi:MAG: hypothetical protein ACPGUE_11105 [Marinomonas sp.]
MKIDANSIHIIQFTKPHHWINTNSNLGGVTLTNKEGESRDFNLTVDSFNELISLLTKINDYEYKDNLIKVCKKNFLLHIEIRRDLQNIATELQYRRSIAGFDCAYKDAFDEAKNNYPLSKRYL